MSDQALDIVLWIGGVGIVIISGLSGILGTLIFRNLDKREKRYDDRDRSNDRASERITAKQGTHGETLAEMRADITALKKDAGKCEELAKDVAVLMDFKERAEDKFDEVDEASRDLRAFGEQLRTAFNKIEDMPDVITARVLAKIPQAVLETLSAARALNGRHVNG